MAPLNGFTLDARLSITGNAVINGQGTGAGVSIPATRKPINFSLDSLLSQAIANNAAGGGNQFYADIVDVTAGGTATLDLQSFTDYLGRSGGVFARIKKIGFCLLPANKGGTAASQITIGDSGTNGNTLFTGAKAHTLILTNGRVIWCDDVSASGITVNASNKDVLITNNDNAVAAKVLVIIAGGES